jgi:hypothetical protein
MSRRDGRSCVGGVIYDNFPKFFPRRQRWTDDGIDDIAPTSGRDVTTSRRPMTTARPRMTTKDDG